MSKDEIYKQHIAGRAAEIRDAIEALNTYYRGKRVRITSEWNGQPYGRSRPSLKGREFEISSVHVSAWQKASIYFHLKGERLSIRPEEFEFIA